jgi:hypothetical protein
MAACKIVSGGFLLYMQGKLTHDIFRPIMKMYDNQDRQAILNCYSNEKKSEDMKVLKKQVWKISGAIIFVIFIQMMVAKNYALTVATDIIQKRYQENISMNVSRPDVINFSIDLDETLKNKTNRYV